MEPTVDLAIRSAIDKRGVAHITIPIDVQQQPLKQSRSERNSLTTPRRVERFRASAGAGGSGTRG